MTEAQAQRLIDAAPDLLAALEDLLRDGSEAYQSRVRANARNVIRKAKGES